MNVFGFHASASACAVAVWRMRSFLLVCVLVGFIRRSGIQRLAFVLFRLGVKFYHLLGVLVCIGRQSKSFLPASAKSSQKKYHVTRQWTGWFLSSFFAIPLRCILRQKCYLKTTGYRNVTRVKSSKATASETPQKQKLYFLKNECFWVFCFG